MFSIFGSPRFQNQIVSAERETERAAKVLRKSACETFRQSEPCDTVETAEYENGTL